MFPFVLQQFKKATWQALKIKDLENLLLWGVAHNLVLCVTLPDTPNYYEQKSDNKI